MSKMEERSLQQIFQQYQLAYSEKKNRVLLDYMEMILERNRQVNLTTITDRDAFIEKHYADSLAAAQLAEFREAGTVLDLGTGGGFPGVPLAVAFPEKQFTLVDSLQKRIRIIREFCEALGIENVNTIHGRAEDLGRDPALREQYGVCVSRAVADLRVLSEYCLPFVKAGGWFIAYKGADCAEEVRSAEHAVEALGGRIHRVVPACKEPECGDRVNAHKLVVIAKVAETPEKYPRRAGMPGKKPL